MAKKPSKEITKSATNARQKADRWVKNFLNVSMNRHYNINSRATARQMVLLLSNLQKQTKIDRNLSAAQNDAKRAQAISKINSIAESGKILRGPKGASNFFTQQMLNLASRSEKFYNVSPYTKVETKAFYRATQDWWQSKGNKVIGTAERNKIIMKKLGTNDLQEAVDFILQKPEVKKQLISQQISDGYITEADLDEEELELFNQLQSDDSGDGDIGSPPWLQAIVPFSEDSEDIQSLRAEFKEWKKK